MVGIKRQSYVGMQIACFSNHIKNRKKKWWALSCAIIHSFALTSKILFAYFDNTTRSKSTVNLFHVGSGKTLHKCLGKCSETMVSGMVLPW